MEITKKKKKGYIKINPKKKNIKNCEIKQQILNIYKLLLLK